MIAPQLGAVYGPGSHANSMDVNIEELNLNCQTQDFEHVYIKQEEQHTPSSTFMITKNEDKRK
jgi:hypothetical protein